MTIVIVAILCYLLSSAFFLLCVMLTAGGNEDGSQITVPPTLSVALRSDARVEPIAVPARSAERTAFASVSAVGS